jgi:hypothetical protein
MVRTVLGTRTVLPTSILGYSAKVLLKAAILDAGGDLILSLELRKAYFALILLCRRVSWEILCAGLIGSSSFGLVKRLLIF